MMAEEWMSSERRLSNEALSAMTARELERQFPGVRAWRGRATGSWWAFVPQGDGGRLVEASHLRGLREAIANAKTWPWQR